MCVLAPRDAVLFIAYVSVLGQTKNCTTYCSQCLIMHMDYLLVSICTTDENVALAKDGDTIEVSKLYTPSVSILIFILGFLKIIV